MKSLKACVAALFLVGCSSSSKYQTIQGKEAKSMMDNQDVVIIDVREENEYKDGHIHGALLIPLGTIKKDNPDLPEKEKTLLVYCRSGNRSAKASKILVDLGYEHVYNFGGILDWPYEIEK